jgi:lysophospholipase L1-like esterase
MNLKALLALLSASLFTIAIRAAEPLPFLHQGDVVLFQGDSITDGNRGRNADPNHILGHGYAFILAAKAGATFPERNLTFINRGISGNKVNDLANRWQNDTLNHRPTLLSILIGVNNLDNTTPEAFEQGYDKLLAETVGALPGVRLVLGQPFTLPSGKYKDGQNNYAARLEKIQAYNAIVEKLGVKYKAVVVNYQKAFEEACKRAPADHWIWDGIHPTYSGHQIMADEWVRTIDAAWRE